MRHDLGAWLMGLAGLLALALAGYSLVRGRIAVTREWVRRAEEPDLFATMVGTFVVCGIGALMLATWMIAG